MNYATQTEIQTIQTKVTHKPLIMQLKTSLFNGSTNISGTFILSWKSTSNDMLRTSSSILTQAVGSTIDEILGSVFLKSFFNNFITLISL